MTKRPAIAHETHGGPDLILFHGGFGCRKHWSRNIVPLSKYFTVHALDHPGYGESGRVSRAI